MSHKISINKGDQKADVAFASASAPTANVEITVNDGVVTTPGELVQILETAKKAVLDKDYPAA